LADGNRKIFLEKIKFVKVSTESKNFSKIGGNLKQEGGNASWPQRGSGRPCIGGRKGSNGSRLRKKRSNLTSRAYLL